MGYNVFLSELCSEVPPCFIFKWMCISHVVCTQYDYENSLIYLLSKHKDKFEFLLSDKFKFLFSGFCKKKLWKYHVHLLFICVQCTHFKLQHVLVPHVLLSCMHYAVQCTKSCTDVHNVNYSILLYASVQCN